MEFIGYENGVNEMVEGLVAAGVLRNGATIKTLEAHLMFDRSNGKGGFRNVAAKRAAQNEFKKLLAVSCGARAALGLQSHFVAIV